MWVSGVVWFEAIEAEAGVKRVVNVLTLCMRWLTFMRALVYAWYMYI